MTVAEKIFYFPETFPSARKAFKPECEKNFWRLLTKNKYFNIFEYVNISIFEYV